MDVDKLKKKRKTTRGIVTKLLNKILEVEKKDPAEIDLRQLRQWLLSLDENFEVLKKLDSDILEKLIENDAEERDLDKEAEDANDIKEKMTYAKICLEELLKGNDNKSNKAHISRSESRESIGSEVSGTSEKSDQIRRRVKAKLPKLELKKFSGKVSQWQEFWDAFKSAIHDDDELASVDKFKYLRSFLEEPARSVIAGFPLTEADYEGAVDVLHKRFARPSVIKKAHINELLNLPPVYSERNVVRLRTLFDQIESHVRSLEALGVAQESYSAIVVPVLMEKIPESLRYNMIRFSSVSNHLDWNVDELIQTFEKELEVRESHVPIFGLQQQQHQPQSQQPKQQKQHGGTAAALFTNEETTCIFCKQKNHASEDCTELTIEERKNVLLKSAKCFNCLRSGHRSFQCKSRSRCKHCKGKHHSAICKGNGPKVSDKEPQAPTGVVSKESAQPKPSAPRASSALNVHAATWPWVGNTAGSGVQVALQTALACVNSEQEKKVRVLFDSGSQKTFISAKAVSMLGLEPERSEELGIQTFGSKEADMAVRRVFKFSLCSLFDCNPTEIEAFEVNEISNVANIHVEQIKHNFAHLSNIFFSDVSRNEEISEIDILCGSDFLWSFQDGEFIRGGPGEPIAISTSLGWVLSGPLKGETINFSEPTNVNLCIENIVPSKKQEADSNLHKLWDLDSIGIREGDQVHETVIDNILFTGSKYSVGLPWRIGHDPVPLNLANSQARLKSQLKKLKQTPEILEQYDQIISEQLKEGIIEEVSNLEPPGPRVSYLPHQAVIRENVETTKVRIVFDASCKDKNTGVSLNSCLHKGPSLTPLIFDILLRFRTDKVVLVGDIEKAFLNIEIHPEDRDSLRFLWVSNIHDKEPQMKVYRYRSMVFGISSSPFLLNAVIRHHLNKYREVDPEFTRDMIEGFFVDDLVTTCKSTSEAYSLYEKAKQRMLEAGLRLRKWKTNDEELRKKIERNEKEVEKRVRENAQDDYSYAKETLGLSKDVGGKTKVLGIPWDTERDTIEFDMSKVGNTPTTVATKRGILSTLAAIFDPLGLISPIAVAAKVLFQELCLEKLNWDDPLPEDKVRRWEAWLEDLKGSDTISLPRCTLGDIDGEIVSATLHGFGDASKHAYCAMVYLVCQTTTGIHTKLLCAKTRVAPLKELSIPKLELMSARILVTLMETVKNSLSSKLKIDAIRFWLDSKTALFWIFNQGEWKTFVQHRVNEILKVSEKEQWGHVPGKENPADIGSRGMTASSLQQSALWWEGPTWLKQGRKAWPKDFSLEDSTEVKEERKKVSVMLNVAQQSMQISKVIDLNRFSTVSKLLRVTAYVQRFLGNLRLKRERRELCLDELTAEELRNAESMWIKDAQQDLKSNENFKKTRESLNLIEQNEILVCKGRLENSELNEECKFPIILPKNHRFTNLVILDCHSRVHHCKVRSTLAELRSRFWVTQGRQYVKKIIMKCFICKKLEGKPYESTAIAPLPEFRVREAPPFSKVGVDFAGPVFVKSQNGMVKAYIALFTCCVTRAIHLELVENLNASTFINCLRRFSARRGTPSLLVTDNAKTFKASAKFIKKLFKNKLVQSHLSTKGIIWRFNLERAAWFGGLFERMIGTVKRCLRKVLGNAKLNFEELTTVLTEIESTINSRPLTYQYDDMVEALTPSHLLCGRRISPLSENVDTSFDESDNELQSNITKRFLYLSRKLSHFWNRWRKEYLVDLREFHKMKDSRVANISKGDLVLIQDDNVKRGQWKVGVIEDLITGKDGIIRGAKVRKAGDQESREELEFTIPQAALFLESAEQLGQGGFGKVLKTDLKGNPVAVKVIKTVHDKDDKRIPLTEGKLLRHLSHDNIVAFRGMGRLDADVKAHNLKADAHFIVMEYIPNNLKRYVERQTTHESKGLPLYLVWDFARQIANGLEYLHTMGDPFKPIAHRDLKPDNILLDTSPMSMRVKLADFGLAYQDIFEGVESKFNIRWVAPEIWRVQVQRGHYDSDDSDADSVSSIESDGSEDEHEREHADDGDEKSEGYASQSCSSASKSGYYPASYEADIDFYLKADIYSYGMVIAFCLTGNSPWGSAKTTILQDVDDWDPAVAKVALPEHIADNDKMRNIIEECYSEDTDLRPTSAREVVAKFFRGVQNPYKSEPSKAEFFFCGFLSNTNIFVADSLVDQTSEGYYRSGEIPKGYPKQCLVCEVAVEERPYHTLPKSREEWEYIELYKKTYRYFQEQVEKRVIENNPTIALKSLVTPREGELEEQEILLRFAEGTYVHHRTMRDIWRQLCDAEREQLVPSKSQVHEAYSTSFGLHVAVLTADNPPKFLFCRRANRVGMASPREYTCGAVESVSKKDCFESTADGKTYVELLKTASRGLEEELRVELVGDEVNTICLTTVYMKYDTHEWGMCGFVDLSDKRIAPERRLTYTQLQSRFTGGPKDKFEHDLVEAVDFSLDSMMDFVRGNFMDFASSGKLVVVKVLQSFFGVRTVELAFQAVDPSHTG